MTEQIYEIINFPDSINMRCFLHEIGVVAGHWHKSIELLLVLSGEAVVAVEDKIYQLKEDNLLLINSNETHRLEGRNCSLVALQIEPDMFTSENDTTKELYFHCVSTDNNSTSHHDFIKEIIAQIINNSSQRKPFSVFKNKAFAYTLIHHLATHCLSPAPSTFKFKKNNQRIRKIIKYIDANYDQHISLEMLSDQMSLTTPYLSKFFKESVGINFASYLASVRLRHAVNDLLHTDCSIEELSVKNGFPNSNAFVSRFRNEYGLLPSVYRKEYRPQSRNLLEYSNTGRISGYIKNGHQDQLNRLIRFIHAEKKPSTAPHSAEHILITANMKITLSKLKHNFKKITCVGKAGDLLISDVQEMLSEMQSEIGYEYIKFHGILDDDMALYYENSKGLPELSFVFVDKVLDFILSIGLRPLLELSFMPKILAKNPERINTQSSFIVSMPKNLKKWRNLIENLIQHFIERYGLEEVKKWLFTVWNEPDSGPDLFGLTEDDFRRLYKSTYTTVKKCDPALQFGSTAFYTGSYYTGTAVTNYLKWCSANECVPDFGLVHFYDIEPIDKIENIASLNQPVKLSKQTDSFSNFIGIVKNIYKECISGSIPIYISEWNSTPSHRDLLSDTVFKSCYFTKHLLENYDKLSGYGYWMLTDLNREMAPSAKLFHGGLGLFTSNGLKKPQYYTFYLINKLGDNLIQKGEGYFITRNLDSEIQIILYNYNHFPDLYASGQMFNITEQNRYSCFNEDLNKCINLKLENVIDGNYTLRQFIVNRDHGSIFDKWIDMGAPELMTQEEMETLKKLSTPLITRELLKAENGTLEFQVNLTLLEVRLMIIKKNKEITQNLNR